MDCKDESIALPLRLAFAQEIIDAELLLKHAAFVGINVDDAIRKAVFDARSASDVDWCSVKANALLIALTTLSHKLYPVCGESLRKCAVDKEAGNAIRRFRWIAFSLGGVALLFSVYASIANATCEAIRKDIEVANGLVLKLVQAISPPTIDLRDTTPEADLKELQELAVLIRDIDTRAQRLSYFGTRSYERRGFELEIPLPHVSFPKEAERAAKTYQDIRYRAQSTQEQVSAQFGACTSCLLPVLYAILGACAYLLRMFEQQLKERRFTGRDKTNARMIVAAIGGLVVGLFGGFGEGHGVALSPLAIAFLVGYGTDVFFYFLDGLLSMFARPREQPAMAKPAHT